MPNYDFNKFAALLQSNFIEIKLRHGHSPVNLLRIIRILFLKNTSGTLLLNVTLNGYSRALPLIGDPKR